MTTATDNTVRLTPEMVGSIRHSIESHLLGLGLEDGGRLEDRLGITSPEPALFEMGRLGRKLALCAELLSEVQTGVIHPREDVLTLLEECETEAAQSVAYEEREGIHPDDLALSQARLVILRHTRSCLRDTAGLPGRGDA